MEMVKYFSFMILLLVAIGLRHVSSNETLIKITSTVLKALEECKHELNFGNNVLNDMYHYWKEDHDLLERDTGCALVCMSKKLNLLDPSGKLHHGNIQEFAAGHGADDDMATKLANIVHECEQKFDKEEDECMRALEIAKCFRVAMHEINWAPKIDVMITEVLTEIE